MIAPRERGSPAAFLRTASSSNDLWTATPSLTGNRAPSQVIVSGAARRVVCRSASARRRRSATDAGSRRAARSWQATTVSRSPIPSILLGSPARASSTSWRCSRERQPVSRATRLARHSVILPACRASRVHSSSVRSAMASATWRCPRACDSRLAKAICAARPRSRLRGRDAPAGGGFALGQHEVRGHLGLRTLRRALQLLQRPDQVDPLRVVEPAPRPSQLLLEPPDLGQRGQHGDAAAAAVPSGVPEIPHAQHARRAHRQRPAALDRGCGQPIVFTGPLLFSVSEHPAEVHHSRRCDADATARPMPRSGGYDTSPTPGQAVASMTRPSGASAEPLTGCITELKPAAMASRATSSSAS